MIDYDSSVDSCYYHRNMGTLAHDTEDTIMIRKNRIGLFDI